MLFGQLKEKIPVILVDDQQRNLDVLHAMYRWYLMRQTHQVTRNCTDTPIVFVSAVADDIDFVYKGYSSGAIEYRVNSKWGLCSQLSESGGTEGQGRHSLPISSEPEKSWSPSCTRLVFVAI